MDAKRLKSREILWAIWRQVEKCQSVFLSPSDLQAFGIQASQVDITDDGVPHFEPRFFEPHPEGVLQKYPIDAAENNYDIRRLDCVPTLQDALDTVQENPPVAEDPLEAAQKLFKDRLESYNFWENYSHASWIHDHIEYELESFREGGPPLFCLEDIAGLQSYVYVINGDTCAIDKLWCLLFVRRDGERDPPMYESWSLSWKSEMFQEDHNETSPLPHAICTIVASVDATVADQDLTLHEMRAIMRMIAIRARGSFRKHPICPVSAHIRYLKLKTNCILTIYSCCLSHIWANSMAESLRLLLKKGELCYSIPSSGALRSRIQRRWNSSFAT